MYFYSSLLAISIYIILKPRDILSWIQDKIYFSLMYKHGYFVNTYSSRS